MKTDSELIASYIGGNARALDTLVGRYLSDVYAFAKRLTRDSDAAEDIAQEAFVKAWNKIRSFRPNANFRTWLFTITRNTALDYLRKKKELAFSAFDTADGGNVISDTLADEVPLPDELLALAEDAAYAQSLLSELNPTYREVLTMRHTGNLTFKEIGTLLGRSLHTVKSQYRRGVLALKRVSREAF